MNNQPLQVSVREVIASKNASLLRWIPEFLLNWFERFVHQDELNRVLRKYHGFDGREFAIKAVEEMGCTIKSFHTERIPKEGPVVFVANNPMAGMDALCYLQRLVESAMNYASLPMMFWRVSRNSKVILSL